jgi:polysaccharide biosynthesis protein PslG
MRLNDVLRLVGLVGLLIVLKVTVGGWLNHGVAQAQTEPRCFETGFCIEGRIREFWEQHGGLPVFGLPTSPLHEQLIEGTPYQVQWFERARLELHPEHPRPYDVQLSRLGAVYVNNQGAPPRDEPREGCRYFEETGFNVCGDILATWQANGLELDGQPGKTDAESLALFGLPLTGAYRTTLSDGNDYQVQWFERARFEVHPENPPHYHVLLGLIGNDLQIGRAHV